MLGVFKPGASRELALRPPRPEKLKCSKCIFGNIIVVVGTNFIDFIYFLVFE